MILTDTESTGLHEIIALPLDRQPHMIEFAGRKIDDQTLEVKEELAMLINPGIPIPAQNTEITGITDEMVKDAKRFAGHYQALCDFFLGEVIVVGHNLPYDIQLLMWELMRIDRVNKFPWPSKHLCTIELTQDLTGKYFNLTDLYKHYYQKDPEQKHRAMGDVDILHEVVRAMRKEGRL